MEPSIYYEMIKQEKHANHETQFETSNYTVYDSAISK